MKRKRIKIDAPFAAIPQALILDPLTSASACRLWGVLFVFHWDGTPPDFDKLAAALAATERSVYRWLQELEARHWIDWDRNKEMLDRFTLHMHSDIVEFDTCVNSPQMELTQVSKELIPRSKKLTPVSEELTQVSISTLFDPAPMPENNTPSSDQKIQKNHVGVGVGRTLTFLIDQGVNAADEFADLPYAAMRADYDARRADRQSNGSIVRAWRHNPPTETYHYEQQRPIQSSIPPNRRSPAEPKNGTALPQNLKLVSSASWRKSDPAD